MVRYCHQVREKSGNLNLHAAQKSEKLSLDPELSGDIVFNVDHYFGKKRSVFGQCFEKKLPVCS